MTPEVTAQAGSARGLLPVPGAPPALIPKLFHIVWFGPMPHSLAVCVDTWVEKHPDWRFIRWGWHNLPGLRNRDLFDRAPELVPEHVGQFRSDLLRYELLEQYGGVYVDCDFECKRPLDDLLRQVHGGMFAAWEDPGVWVNNAIMGAVPEHPVATMLIDGLEEHVVENLAPGVRPNVLSGPQYLTKVLNGCQQGAATVFPKDWFYPYLWDELHRADESFPDAIAVHHWNNMRVRKNVPRD